MKFFRTISCVLTASLLGACSAPMPNRTEATSADYGEKPSYEAALSLVKEYMAARLIDPFSAVYSCAQPIKAWASTSKLVHAELGGRVHYGYVMPCMINAKNRMGGYVGAEKRNFMIKINAGQSNIYELPYPIAAVPAPN